MRRSKIIVLGIAVLMISSMMIFGLKKGGANLNLESLEEYENELSSSSKPESKADESVNQPTDRSHQSGIYMQREKFATNERRFRGYFPINGKNIYETIDPGYSIKQHNERDPICIDGNEDFENQAISEEWSGSGTEMDPWIIEGYKINATGYENAIYIGNVDAYFIIRDCVIYDAMLFEAFNPPYQWPSGILLNNTENGLIEENEIFANGAGIFVRGGRYNLVVNNTVSWNGVGTMLFETSENYIIGNTYWDNYYGAIGIWDTTDTYVGENTMNDNGIIILGNLLEFWNTHTIDNENTVHGNPVIYWKNENGGKVPSDVGQVILANCTDAIVENQEHSVSIMLGFSDNCTIQNNSLTPGVIDLVASSGNLINENELIENPGDAIWLYFQSDDNMVTNNTILNNEIGIYIEDLCSGNQIAHNNITGSLDEGIMIDMSMDNNIYKNEVSNNNWGIAMANSDFNIVDNNTVFDNNEIGIEMFYGSMGNMVKYNEITGGDIGVHHWEATENTVEHNTISNTSWTGINLGSSDNNTVQHNDIAFCDDSGMHIWDSHGNDILHNLISDSHMNGIGIFDSTDNLLDGNFIQNNGDNGISIGNSNFITAQNNDVSYQNMGFNLFQSGNNVLLNNSAMNNHHGFNLHQSYDNTLLENEVKENDHGIHLSDSDHNILSDNQISYNIFEGINLQNSYHNELINNHISFNNDEGIHVNHSDVNLIKNNTLGHQGAGIHIQNSNSNDIISNEVSNSDWYGISIWASSDSLLYDNDIFENDSGIAIEDSDQNYVVYNFISNNDQNGIQLFGSHENVLFHNSFVANSNHAWDEGTNIWNNEYPSGGNYWDHHTSPDEFGGWDQNEPGPDGIVDDPYDVPGNVNQDEYPLTEEPVRLEYGLNLSAEPESDGWQFISLTIIPDHTYITEVLDSIEGSYEKVMYYDSYADEWNSYVPGRFGHFNNIYTLDQNMGFWINMNEDTEVSVMGRMPTVTSNVLHPGWNMVSVPSGTAGNLDLPEEITKVGYFDASQEYNLLYDHDPSTFIFEPWQGYWVYNGAEEHVIWTVEY